MIDLHTHTTASDGRLTPAELVARASAAGLTILAVTDHDTVAAVDAVTDLAAPLGVRVVAGIEITSVDEGRDVHMLGYFFDPHDASLAAFLTAQRVLRVSRVEEIGRRLAALGVAVDVERLVASAAATPGTSIGRPWLARALVAAGHAESVPDAFMRLLGVGQPAFVPRVGSSPASVIRIIHDAGGVASFAHPGVTKKDALLAPLVHDGLDAIECFHSDHSPTTREVYRSMASSFGVCVSGGSDFHGSGGTRATLGVSVLPPDEFALLEARATARRVATDGPRA